MEAEFRYDEIDLRDITSLAVEADGAITVGFYPPSAAFESIANDDLASRRVIRFRARLGDKFAQESMGVLTRISFSDGKWSPSYGEITVRPMPQKLESQ